MSRLPSRFLPLLVMPQLMTLRNAWRRRAERREHWIRNGVLFAMTVLIMFAAYHGGMWVLRQLQTQLDFAYLHPSTVLGLIFLFLSGLLVITNLVAATGALFMSKDLELIISSPLSHFRFFWGKFFEIIISSSWMTAVFFFPVIVLFGRFYQGGWDYYLMAVLILPPFFILPAAVAVLVSTAMALLIPANRKREIGFLLLLIGLFIFYLLGKMLAASLADTGPIDATDIFRVIALLTLSNKPWSPSYWSAAILADSLVPLGINSKAYLLLSYSTTAFFAVTAFLTVRLLHFYGMSRAALHAHSSKYPSRKRQELWRRFTARLSLPMRALLVKEVNTSSRDVTQIVQALFLFGLCALYLYMLSFQGLFQQVLPANQQRWWKLFLVITNLCIEAFVTTAMANRLVFPSIAREGRAFWILQTAPVSIKRVLQSKFIAWIVVVSVVTSLIYGLAALLLSGSVPLTLCKVVLNLATTIGVVGLAVGCGAHFADFDWDHPAQLTTGFGNLVYTLVAVLLIAFNLVLGSGLLIFIYTSSLRGRMGFGQSVSVSVLSLVLIVGINVLIGNRAVKFGAESLVAREA